MKKVLIVEDVPDIIRAFTAMINFLGSYEISSSRSNEETKIKLQQEFDIILWDRNILDGTTDDLIEVATKQHPNCLHVGISVDGTEIQVSKGCTIALPKPFSLAELKKVLQLANESVVA